jgi:phosphatidylglycerophosphatase A
MQTDPDPALAPALSKQRSSSHYAGASDASPALNASFMWSHPLHAISLGFGSGLSAIMPGTMGTLFAWLSFTVLNRYLNAVEWGLLIGVGFLAGLAITDFTARKLRRTDPSAIVWDEIVAFWLVLLMVTPASFAAQCAAFVLFRFFDMVKPPPIGYYERKLKGGIGIMVDDMLAAFFTLIVIALWRSA